MRLIDADTLIEILTTAIRNMKGMAKFIGAEDDPEIQMEIKAYTDIADGVKDMPTIEERKTGQWIPSGEKPPEEGSYLVWMPFAQPKHRMAVAEYCGGYWNIKTPISAWMPLPEPYRGEDEQ